MPDFSVVTIVKGRRQQLANLLDSVARATILPVDVHVVCMDNTNDVVVPKDLPVTVHALCSGETLPLAAARNAGIAAATTNNVIFIDVDCIVSPTLLETMLASLTPTSVIAAYPLYLPIVPDNGDYNASSVLAIAHPARQTIKANKPVDHLQFWSIIFAIQKSTFTNVGGFDEHFTGYGAEDTDFAMSFNKAGVSLIFAKDYVLHQYHSKYDPPLNHFDAIIRNAETYRQKWGEFPMQHWLRGFAARGLVMFNENSIIVQRQPTEQEIDNSISINPY